MTTLSKGIYAPRNPVFGYGGIQKEVQRVINTYFSLGNFTIDDVFDASGHDVSTSASRWQTLTDRDGRDEQGRWNRDRTDRGILSERVGGTKPSWQGVRHGPVPPLLPHPRPRRSLPLRMWCHHDASVRP